ncbi:MAG: YCF48-related protein [Armatimonadota bacterium]|nr:YCF48-related protein [Armatimonadota bacterium]
MTQRTIRILVVAALLLVSLLPSAFGGLSPYEVVVVVNNNPQAPDLAQASRAVADYYCAQRGIPSENIVEIDAPVYEVLADPLLYAERIAGPIETALQSLGSDPDHPESDPIKCIVLCYGVPSNIHTANRYCSVDSALTMLFERAPWGRVAMAGVDNENNSSYDWVRAYSPDAAYQDSGGTSYLTARGSKPADFGEFRSSQYNSVTEAAPKFTVVRMLNDVQPPAISTAIAVGHQGMLYRGVLDSGIWTWTPTIDENKDYVANTVSDVCVVNSTTAYACTGPSAAYGGSFHSNGGSVLKTIDGGLTWTAMRTAPYADTYLCPVPGDGLTQISFYNADNGWAVGKTAVGAAAAVVIKTYNGGNSWTDLKDYLPSGFTEARAVAAVDSTYVWVAGNTGLYRVTDNGQTWTEQKLDQVSITTIRRLAIRNVQGQYKGWAIGPSPTRYFYHRYFYHLTNERLASTIDVGSPVFGAGFVEVLLRIPGAALLAANPSGGKESVI